MTSIIEKKIEELIPYENNPRINDESVEYVANSIKEFGFKVPIVIDSNNVIIAGHTRLKASKKLGLESVPCIIADDLTDEQVRAFRLADNKASELSTWDMEKLNLELDTLYEINMQDFGFIDLTDYSNSSEDKEEDPDDFEDIERLESHYGVPYQGNKSRIADIIISILPAGKRLVDLFGGGGAITHCALLSNKWESFLYNDLNPMITGLFMDAVNGKYHDEHRVITREEFNNLKDSDAYVKYIWSFGNAGDAYLWGKDIEDIKVTACHALMDETLKDRRLAYIHFVKDIKSKHIESLNRLQSIEHLQALTQLEALQRLEASNMDYHEYKYQDGDVVYCDVPYEKLGKKGCDDYGVDFDSLGFYEWVKAQPYQIFFSSYEISDDSFYKKKVKAIMSLMGAHTNGSFVNEYIYSNKPIDG